MSMMCIYPDLIQAVAADTESSVYPKENVLDDVPSLPWQATAKSGTLTFAVGGGSEGIGLSGLNGISVDIEVKDKDLQVVFAKSYDLAGIDSYYKFFTQRSKPKTSLGVVYPYQSYDHTILVQVNTGNDSVPAECGTAKAGPLYRWPNPVNPIQITPRDYAVKDRYGSGGLYYVPLSRVHGFNISVPLDLETEFFTFMDDLYMQVGASPLFWWLDNSDTTPWTVYAGIEEEPSFSARLPLVMSTFKLLEEK